jgi:hypothetical protein
VLHQVWAANQCSDTGCHPNQQQWQLHELNQGHSCLLLLGLLLHGLLLLPVLL